jgi:hypothetical protein
MGGLRMKLRLRIVMAIAAVAITVNIAVAASSFAGAGQVVSAGSVARLSSAGATEWNFDALLRQTFGSGLICSLASKSGSPLNFPKNDEDCTPLATYSPWIFDFKDLGRSSFHVMSKKYTQKGWVANSSPVLIEGKLIACNKNGTQVLMGFSDEPSDAIGCGVNPYTHGY